VDELVARFGGEGANRQLLAAGEGVSVPAAAVEAAATAALLPPPLLLQQASGGGGGFVPATVLGGPRALNGNDSVYDLLVGGEGAGGGSHGQLVSLPRGSIQLLPSPSSPSTLSVTPASAVEWLRANAALHVVPADYAVPGASPRLWLVTKQELLPGGSGGGGGGTSAADARAALVAARGGSGAAAVLAYDALCSAAVAAAGATGGGAAATPAAAAAAAKKPGAPRAPRSRPASAANLKRRASSASGGNLAVASSPAPSTAGGPSPSNSLANSDDTPATYPPARLLAAIGALVRSPAERAASFSNNAAAVAAVAVASAAGLPAPPAAADAVATMAAASPVGSRDLPPAIVEAIRMFVAAAGGQPVAEAALEAAGGGGGGSGGGGAGAGAEASSAAPSTAQAQQPRLPPPVAALLRQLADPEAPPRIPMAELLVPPAERPEATAARLPPGSIKRAAFDALAAPGVGETGLDADSILSYALATGVSVPRPPTVAQGEKFFTFSFTFFWGGGGSRGRKRPRIEKNSLFLSLFSTLPV
jgi:hypothetical protein